MAKLSQCAKCDYDRRICGHYKSEDDMDCPHYACRGVLQDVEPKSNMDTIISMAFGIPQIPDIEIYLQTTFNSMLQSHQFFFQMMEKLRREEYSNH